MKCREWGVVGVLAVVMAFSLSWMTAAPGFSESRDETEISPDLFSSLTYRMVGPSRGGRVTAVAGHVDRPSTFYMGATGGGVWKTTNYGQTWRPISDGYFATGSIGAIRVADSDPDVLFVGTGSDGLRSNVIIGKGVYKSKDAGQTWEHMGLRSAGCIGAVLIHPSNPDLVYVAAIGNPFTPNPERGVFRTTDGGVNWEKVFFISDETGAVDLEFAPDNPLEIYAVMWRAERKPWTIISGGDEGGVYKSSDGGESWVELKQGLPTGLRGKGDLAVSPADPDRVYVLIEAPGTAGGLYRSDDRGGVWEQVTDFQPIRNRPFYYTNLAANPQNADVLWGMAEGHYQSEDAGKTWKRKSTPHGDNHDMWINPENPDLLIQANDGGANVSRDGGVTWSTQSNQPTAELYQVDVSDEFPYRLYAGQQDNSTISVPSFPARPEPGGSVSSWEEHGGCETGPVVPKPGDPDIVYANCKGRFGVYNRRTGQEQQYYVGFGNLYGHNPKDLEYRFQRVAPVHVSPHDPNRVYHGSQFLHVTEDGGQSWQTISPDLTAFTPETQVVSGAPITIDVTGEEHFSVLYEIQESTHESGVVWTGSNDGPIYLTRDGGKTWQDVTPGEIGPYGRVQTIEVSPHEPSKAYAAILRYQLGDFRPYVFKTRDYGQTWVLITTGTNGIPGDYPVRVVREDPDRPGLLYAGTEFGMFISFDDGLEWQPFQLNLPVTPVTDMKIVDKDLVLSTMGRSFWILSDLTPLHEAPELSPSSPHLFAIRDAYRLRGSGRSWRARAPHDPEYAPVGANIDYYLPADASSTIELEVLDSNGNRVARLVSQDNGKTDDGESEESSPGQTPTPELNSGKGMHRFVWRLRYPGPGGGGGRSSRGPMVSPGRYRARLTVGDWNAEREFQVRMDPRVLQEGVTAEDVEAQLELSLKVRDALGQARDAARRLKKATVAEDGSAPVDKPELEEIQSRLVTEPVRYSQPMLIDQLSYLYGNLGTADQKPGRDAYLRFETLSQELQEILGKLDEVLKHP